MPATAPDTGRQRVRLGIVALLVVLCAGLGAYVHLVLGTDAVYTHFAYVPIVLAGAWWGRRGVLVAGILAAVVISFHLLGLKGGANLWHDVVRIALFGVVVVCIAELSEQAQASRRALARSEANHRLIVDKSLTGILLYRDEQILFANSRLCDMLGYADTELVGKPIWHLIHQSDVPTVRAAVDRRRREGFADLHYETRLVRKIPATYL